MAVIALPDVMGAAVARLRSFSEIRALVASSGGYTPTATPDERARPRVSPVLQSFWAMPHYAIVVSGPIGKPPIDDSEHGIHAMRTDLHIYGPDPFRAMSLWRIVEPALCPLQGLAFDSAGVRFEGVTREGGPTALPEPQTNYPKVVATYVWLSSGVPIS